MFEGMDARRRSGSSFRSGMEPRRCKLSSKVLGMEVRRSCKGSSSPMGFSARSCCKALGAEPIRSGDGDRPPSFLRGPSLFSRKACTRPLSDCTRIGADDPFGVGSLPALHGVSGAASLPPRRRDEAVAGARVGGRTRRWCSGLCGEVGRDCAAATPSDAEQLRDSGDEDDWRTLPLRPESRERPADGKFFRCR